MRFKKLLANPGTQWLYPLAILAVGLLAYTAVLIIGIPSKINLILSAPDSTFLFITIVLLLYLAFRPSGWIGTLISFSATLILFATQLSAVWRSSAGGSFYPELLSLSLAERSQRVYELAFEALQANPFALVIGVIKAWKQFLFDDFVFSFVTSAKINVTLQVLSLVAIVDCYRQRQNPSASLMIAVLIGILLIDMGCEPEFSNSSLGT